MVNCDVCKGRCDNFKKIKDVQMGVLIVCDDCYRDFEEKRFKNLVDKIVNKRFKKINKIFGMIHIIHIIAIILVTCTWIVIGYTNFELVGMVFIIIGSSLNFLVVSTNKWKMPVLEENKHYYLAHIFKVSHRHFPYIEEDSKHIKFKMLSDRFSLSFLTHNFKYSIGDVFLFSGMGILLSSLIKTIVI